ncbi:DUF2066 domain-containing protein [Idiomarina xiamenensis]|uniref:DUF2066 domain-containing protein n=1 Tax=Idiomarina xiamenensis 10-D-4 TaxID=740709 RepID=K2KWJ7_9GAMM|nr:DUF2066 domain-containing protein [Idiomarina xiamenensis]EKE86854.1 hypothetical protein A10D4_01392 [Idiomarina xiamenensis 10-D-4]
MLPLMRALTLALLTSVLSWSTLAATVSDIYEGRVGVSSQTPDERQQALQDAFKQSLVKVAGDPAIVEHAKVRQALRNLNDYLVQYAYQQQQGQLQLQASFEQQRVNQLLTDIGANIWGSRRPTLMLWIAQQDNDGHRHILSNADETVFMQQIVNRARERGLPIALPLMDLSDSMAVNVSDVWGRFNQPLRDAAARYQADGIVVARVMPANQSNLSADSDGSTAANWVVDWTVSVGEQRLHGQTLGADLSLTAAPFIDDVTNQVAAAYSVSTQPGDASEMTLRVVNLDSMAAILELEQYLNSLTSVAHVNLQQFGNGRAQFSLQLLGNPERVAQALELDNRLRKVKRDPFSFDQTSELLYYWIRR